MAQAQVMMERKQTVGEEIANSVSHGIAMLAALAAAPVLIIAATQNGNTAHVVGTAVFAAAMFLLYLTSTLYHMLPANRAKQILQILDHAAIFLMIAGTYTPFTLGVLRGTWGWALFGTVWSLAAAGIALKVIFGTRYPKLSLFIYLAMGWLIVLAVKPLLWNVSAWGIFWLLAGGLAYTVGTVFFAAGDRIRYGHFIWHLFVIAGTGCHFVAVLKYSG